MTRTNLNESIYGSNVEEGFEVVRTKSWVHRGKWFVSIRNKETWQWHHSEAVYNKKEAKGVFDRYCTMSNKEIREVLYSRTVYRIQEISLSKEEV